MARKATKTTEQIEIEGLKGTIFTLQTNFEIFQDEISGQIAHLQLEGNALLAAKQRAHARAQRSIVELNQRIEVLKIAGPQKQTNGNK